MTIKCHSRSGLFCQATSAVLLLIAANIPVRAASAPEMVLQLGNPLASKANCVSANAPFMATRSGDGIKIWNTKTWELMRAFPLKSSPAHDTSYLSFALSPNGLLLAALTSRHMLQIWNIEDGVCIKRIAIAMSVSFLSFTPNCKSVVTSSFPPYGVNNPAEKGKTVFWRIASGVRQYAIPAGGDVAVSPNGKSLAVWGDSASQDAGVVSLWDIKTGKMLHAFAGRPEIAGPLRFSPDGRTLAADADAPAPPNPAAPPSMPDITPTPLEIILWDVQTGKVLRVLPENPNSSAQAPVFTKDSADIADLSSMTVWSMATGTRIHKTVMDGPALFLYGNTALSQMCSHFVIYNIATGTVHPFHPPHPFLETAYADRAVFSPQGGLLAVSELFDHNSFLSLWDLDAANIRWEKPQGQLLGLVFSPNAKLITCNSYQKIAIRDAATGAVKHTFSNGVPDKINTMSPNLTELMAGADIMLSPDGKTLVRKMNAVDSGGLQVYNARTHALRLTIPSFDDTLDHAVISPNGSLIASTINPAGAMGVPIPPKVGIWSLQTGKLVASVPSSSNIFRFSPLGNTLAIADNYVDQAAGVGAVKQRRLAFWNVHTGRLVYSLNLGPGGVGSFSFSAHGKRIAVANGDKIKIIALPSGRIQSVITERHRNLSLLAMSPDFSKALTTTDAYNGDQSFTQLWRVRDGALLATLINFSRDNAPTRGWVIVTPQGYYAASPGVEQVIRWHVGSHLYPAARFESRFRRPDRVRKILMRP